MCQISGYSAKMQHHRRCFAMLFHVAAQRPKNTICKIVPERIRFVNLRTPPRWSVFIYNSSWRRLYRRREVWWISTWSLCMRSILPTISKRTKIVWCKVPEHIANKVKTNKVKIEELNDHVLYQQRKLKLGQEARNENCCTCEKSKIILL